MTIYKDLDWSKLYDLLEEFHLSYNNIKPCRINSIEIICNRIDVDSKSIQFMNEMEELNFICEDYSYSYWTQYVAKIKLKENQKFNLILDWDLFEIQLIGEVED